MKSIMLGGISVKDLHGPWSDFMQKLQGEESAEYFAAFKLMLRKQNPWPPKWREENGVIYFSVTSDDTAGKYWIPRHESNGLHVGYDAKQVLRSSDFKPTSGMTTEVAVLKGMLFEDNNRITKKIRAEAEKRKLQKPNAELACLIRERFTDEEIRQMGLQYIVAMHEPINNSDGDGCLLSAGCSDGGHWLSASYDRPDRRWDREHGFAFAVSQVSSQL